MKKEELNSVEKTQVLYLSVIYGMLEVATNHFSNKQIKKSFDCLNSRVVS
jgi:hypothetical protein